MLNLRRNILKFLNSHKEFAAAMFILLCLSGCLVELHQVSDVYFKYRTSTKIEYVVKEIENYQTLVYCPRFTDILNRTRYKEYGILPQPPQRLKYVYREVSSLTIKDIMDLTPKASETMNGCFVRNNNSSGKLKLELDSTECYKLFSITKSVNGERVCYSFMPQIRVNYSVGEAASALTHETIAYEIHLSSSIGRGNVGMVISHFINPNVDTYYEPLISRMYGSQRVNRNTFKESIFFVYGVSFEILRLPHPYERGCTSGHYQQKCYEECLLKNLRTINRASFSWFHTQLLDIKLLTWNDFENKTMVNMTHSIYQQCHVNCMTKLDCYMDFSITSVKENKNPMKSFMIISMIPKGPYTFAYSIPLLNFVDYFCHVGSSLGIWLGLSVFSLDPVIFLTYREKRKSQSVGVQEPAKSVERQGTISSLVAPPKCPCSLCFKRYLYTCFQVINASNRAK